MARKKNLERAIILGLILSTGVYGTVFAEQLKDGPQSNVNWTDKDGDGDIRSVVEDGDGGSGNIFISGNVDISGKLTLINTQKGQTTGKGINAYNGVVNIKASEIDIQTYDDGIYTTGRQGEDISPGVKADVNLSGFNSLNIVSTNGFGIVNNGNLYGSIFSIKDYGDVVVTGNANSIIEIQGGYNVEASSLQISGKAAVKNAYKDSETIINANGGTVKLQGVGFGTWASAGNLKVYGANNTINGILDDRFINNYDANSYKNFGIGIYNSNSNAVTTIEAAENNSIHGDKEAVYAYAGNVNITGKNNYFDVSYDENIVREDLKESAQNADRYAIHTTSGNVSAHATDGNNVINSIATGIYGAGKGTVTLTAENGQNIIYAGKMIEGQDDYGNTILYGDNYGIKSEKGNVTTLEAGLNNIKGAIYANGSGSNVYGKEVEGVTASNYVYSAAVIEDAGDIDTESNEDTNKFYGKKFVSALYAENGANIELNGENVIGTWADSGDSSTLERTVWAYSSDETIGSSINITGASIIGTDRYSTSPNSADVAIAAGTATDLSKSDVKNFVNEEKNGNAERSTVTFKYDNFDDGKSSSISGDILAAYAGLVDISTDNSEAGINITGNLLAGNNGILSVDLGKGGVLTGRADDYGNAGYVDDGRVGSDLNGEQKTFYDPAFSSTIFSGGNVGLKMGAGSRWNVTGQSWITSIDTSNANGETQNERATIDLVNYYKDETGKNNTNAHALTVYDFNGDADFIMNLDGNRANSDMLYMKKANGTYRINLIDVVTTDEINSDHNGKYFSGLRFATVGNKNSNVTFLVGSYDNGGAFNVEYEVGTDEYGGTETADENTVYNGGSINSGKPGDSMVDGLFGNNDAPVGSEPENENDASSMNLVAANDIILMNEDAVMLDETAAAANDAADYNATNHKIIARLGEELNDTGKTILNMSRANYSNAIYMDRLNKRLGEARYINSEEDEGMWVRIRHDRIGKDDAYRSQNTMYELGYDQKQECDNGERRVGMAIDYMHGDTGYDQIAGKGEIDRYGLWLYDTWMGDKGHYADYVAKWGHLSNDFEVYTMQNGDKVTGDYSNNVFSVSAEYGRKKDIGNDWYFEPQVQAQLARVTGADYTTNQGTKVSVDGINSLIGRAGFRLGKDFGEEKQSTVYIKADVLHEFLGDQDVRVLDKSSDNKWAGISYENEGTWYDVGFGFATQMSKNSYAFMDFEKSFGNDNDETYQINVGMQWSF